MIGLLENNYLAIVEWLNGESKMRNRSITCLVLLIFLPMNSLISAQENNRLSNGGTVYVPAYSHIYSGNKETPFLLAVTLSIRNTDPNHPIKILTVDYYETQGKLLKRYVSSPFTLNALGTARYIIPQSDKAGGSGANFIVEWEALQPINSPLIETIMIGSRSSFTARGQVIVPSD